MSRKNQIRLHVTCICRHLGRGMVYVRRLDSRDTAAELRAVSFDLSGIVRAVFPSLRRARPGGGCESSILPAEHSAARTVIYKASKKESGLKTKTEIEL